MIIVGYQGIGKSTLGGKCGYIDLESSSFNDIIDPAKKIDNWYVSYYRIANALSKQGYTVFVSSHKDVREWLKFTDEKVVIVFPALELEKAWVDKLKNRYCTTWSGKDYRAYVNAEKYYKETSQTL